MEIDLNLEEEERNSFNIQRQIQDIQTQLARNNQLCEQLRPVSASLNTINTALHQLEQRVLHDEDQQAQSLEQVTQVRHTATII